MKKYFVFFMMSINLKPHSLECGRNFRVLNFGSSKNSNKPHTLVCGKHKNFLIFAVLFSLLVPSVFSLGITPGRTSFDYNKDMEKEITFSVLNNEHKNMQVFLSVQGELNESIKLYNSLIEFNSNEESKQFKYVFKIKNDISNKPGLHSGEIVAYEIPKLNSDGSYVGATVAVVSQVYVYVSCPGKCIDTDLNILDGEINETATFIVPVINRGQLGIGEARALIDIYNSMNEKIESVKTDYLPVIPGSRTELSAKWYVNVNPGNYLAKVSVFYDGESTSFDKPFSVGTNTLTIESILVNDFKLGEIAKLQIFVENKWTEEVKSVFANLLVFNNENQIMADVKSSNEDIPPLSKKVLVAYWDTIGVQEGDYNGKLMVRYGKKSADKNLVLKVQENSLDIFGVGYAITPKGGNGIDVQVVLIALIIILIILNISWFVFFKIKMSKENKK